MKQQNLHNLIFLLLLLLSASIYAQEIPLPEHPRPDFQREQWQNLNGTWAFTFDDLDKGIQEGWAEGSTAFDKTILVPFPWGSKLSGVKDEADIGWYQREIKVNQNWQGKRVFLTVGASDWETSIWLDGTLLGKHQGGYVPFSFELTDHIKYGKAHNLVIRVDDAHRNFALTGKQGYGNARGIWQTIYLEARGNDYLDALHFSPDIDNNIVTVTAYLSEVTNQDIPLTLTINNPGDPITNQTTIPAGKNKIKFDVAIPDPRLWNLEDPYLYEVEAKLEEDVVSSYFGMRKISVVNLPGTEYPYIALNDEPVYLQLALDQSYHPDGFYTFPSDQFMKDEILRSKSIGLNGIRIHVKVEVPRKLYWADKLGLLVMADLPNSWGQPDEKMKAESEYTLREMIKRDYNHPSIFSWVIFNEQWGLYTYTGMGENSRPTCEFAYKAGHEYLPETQAWVASMYYLAKSLDQTRLVEDNSTNSTCYGRGHTETDINSWHLYVPGWLWDDYLKNWVENTYEGSSFNFEDGYQQGNQPNINSECGNVWGYEGSTGDVDWSWDYHRMINTFRKYPKIAGWLFTELHDVINEWNGYWRYDRTEKETGLGAIVEGMSVNDFHSAVYLSTGIEICKTVNGGESIEVPLYLSVMTGEEYGADLKISYELSTTNYIGEKEKNLSGSLKVAYTPWMQKTLKPLAIQVPDISGIATLQFKVTDQDGQILHRNFMNFEIISEQQIPKVTVLSTPVDNFSGAEWSKMQWNVMEGKKVNGAGKGFFQYSIPIPEGMNSRGIKEAFFLVEVSAKEFFVKDQEDQEEYERSQDFMEGSIVSPSANPNSYPMTDERLYPSKISVSINGQKVYTITLADDPADHRGVLSWHHQLKDRKLREAGSYGYLIKVPIEQGMLQSAFQEGELVVLLQTEGEGGIAVYGKEFGRYALDPSLVLKK
jgi:hypothetical protein